jgi:hypothetical protein
LGIRIAWEFPLLKIFAIEVIIFPH